MSNSTQSLQIPPEYSLPLLNLSLIHKKMDSLQRFLSESLNNSKLLSHQQINSVSAEISAAIHQTIVNGAALISASHSTKPNHSPTINAPFKEEEKEVCEIVELDAVELLAEHVHFCEICGKGFKRDANLRMHMRAHGNQYKTTEALAKPHGSGCETASFKRRFSCPYDGCNRNKKHRKFRPLKSVICVKNHFKRSHCPKMYACNRCNKKSFSVVADLKSHLKHCGESRWKCSCGTSFSRKDKLFGHMALFEGHMPAVAAEDKCVEEEEENFAELDNGFFEGLVFDGFGDMYGYSLQDMLNSPNVNEWQ